MQRMLTRLTLATLLLTASTLASAVLPLQGRDINGSPVAATDASAVFEYDPNLNITWLRDWNVNGQANWYTQTAWAASLTYFGGGWRLPTTPQPDPSCGIQDLDPTYGPQGSGTGCTGSEMGYLYNTEGITPDNPGPFRNIQRWYYWSGSEYPPVFLALNAWIFHALTGQQTAEQKFINNYATAVRPGDVAPRPPTAATAAATAISQGGATLNGTVTANGASTTVLFGYGLTITYGTSVAAAQSPLAGSASDAAVSVPIAGLQCNTLYHFHVTANNGTGGTIDGGDFTFATAACTASNVAPSPIPTLSDYALLLLAVLLGGCGLLRSRDGRNVWH